MNWMRWWFERWLPLPPLFSLCHRQKLRARLSLAKPRTTILPLLKQDSDCIFVCLYRGIHRPFFHSAGPTESGVGSDVRRRPLGSTTYTPPSPHTGIELGPLTADEKDGDPMPSSRPREREGLNPSQILRKPPSRRQGMNLPPLHEQQRGSSREKSPDAGTSTCLSRPASLVLASQTPASPSSRPAVSKPIYNAANPTPSKFISLLAITRLFSFSATCLSPIHQPWGASPLTRRASSEAAETDKASLTSPPARPFRLLNRSRVAESAATRRRTERRYLPPASTGSGGRPPLPPSSA